MCGWVEEFFLLISLGFPPTGLPSPGLFPVWVSLRYGGCGGGQISLGFVVPIRSARPYRLFGLLQQ